MTNYIHPPRPVRCQERRSDTEPRRDRQLRSVGTDEEVVESARYALRYGMPDGGYIFSTSNCVYTGLRLGRYELMLDVWRREGNYQA